MTGSALLDAAAVRRWGAAAAAALHHARTGIDAINVFPVADADTGTNLALTWRAAADVEAEHEADACRLLQRMAEAALDAAHGSSGTILGQFLHGFAAGAPDLGRALAQAASAAYDAVAEPVEGTILTVATAAAAGAAAVADGDAAAVAVAAAEAARRALQQTPTQLAVLAEHGVVDAGGRGLVVVLDSLVTAVRGEPLVDLGADEWVTEPLCVTAAGERFEVQFRVDGEADAAGMLRQALAELGDAVVVAGGPVTHRVHVHTADVGAVLEAAYGVGRPVGIRVALLPATAGVVASRVVAVAPGGALADVFAAAGASVVTYHAGDDVTTALRAALASRGELSTFLLPNDRDLRDAADAVAAELRAVGGDVAVIPTRSPLQGLAALAVHDPAGRHDEVAVAMSSAAAATRYAAVTVASEDALTTAGPCRAGDVLGLIDDDVAVIAPDLAAATLGLVDRMLIGGGELVTIVVAGPEAAAVAGTVVDYLEASRPVVQTTVYTDGDPQRPILVGVE